MKKEDIYKSGIEVKEADASEAIKLLYTNEWIAVNASSDLFILVKICK